MLRADTDFMERGWMPPAKAGSRLGWIVASALAIANVILVMGLDAIDRTYTGCARRRFNWIACSDSSVGRYLCGGPWFVIGDLA